MIPPLITHPVLWCNLIGNGNGTSVSAHGAQVAPSGRPLGGANLYSVLCNL
jgi:hypothetical protein